MVKQILTLAIAAVAVVANAEDKPFTIKSFFDGSWNARSVSSFRSTADGKHYTALTQGGRAIVKYQYSNGAAVDTLLNLDRVKGEEGADYSKLRITDYELSQDEERILFYSNPEYVYRRSFKADYYYYVIESGGVRRGNIARLTQGKVQAATLAPDGRQVAFQRDNNLFLVKIMSASIEKSERAVTEDGAWNKIINGTPDWVYEEEFPMNRAYCWTPDSKYLCYLKFDESQVKEYTLPQYRGEAPRRDAYELYPGIYSYKYPVAGETNSAVTVWSYDIYNRKNRQMNVPCYADGYIMRLRPTCDATQLAVMTLNRHQSDFRMYFVNPGSGVSKLIVRDTNEQYVGESNMDDIHFYEDGFTFVSEKSGYRHLYYYDMLGTQKRQITKGNFDVTTVYGYDPKSRSAYVQTAWMGDGATLPSELTRGIYKVDGKGQMLPLFNGGKDGAGCRGTHNAAFSNNFLYMQHFYSDADQPTKVTLETVKDLRVLKVLEDNADYFSARLHNATVAKREFVQFTTPNGDILNGYVMKPHNFDSSRKYPVLMYQYGGPGNQQVLDSWKFNWEQFLCQEGYVVACFDGRGTGGRGAKWERQTYCELGVRECEDQLHAGRYMASLPYVDSSRLSIWGWSFGGYNTLMTLCGGNDVFKVGIAVAPVTDWKFYDSVYTERYMRTPQENADGYAKSSVLNRAKDLKGNLYIITGTIDDNVHPQNTFEFTEQLVQADIPFDMHVFTNRDHGIRGGNTSNFIYGQIFRYLQKNL